MICVAGAEYCFVFIVICLCFLILRSINATLICLLFANAFVFNEKLINYLCNRFEYMKRWALEHELWRQWLKKLWFAGFLTDLTSRPGFCGIWNKSLIDFNPKMVSKSWNVVEVPKMAWKFENGIEVRKRRRNSEMASKFENGVEIRKWRRRSKIASIYGNVVEVRKCSRSSKISSRFGNGVEVRRRHWSSKRRRSSKMASEFENDAQTPHLANGNHDRH